MKRGPRKSPNPTTVAALNELDARPQQKPAWKARAGTNWDAEKSAAFVDSIHGEGTEWRDYSTHTRFDLPDEAHDWLRQNRLSAQWITEEVYGEKQSDHFNGFLRNHWRPAEPGVVPGVETTKIGGSVLCLRSMVITEKARKAEQAKARAEIELKAQAFTGGEIRASGANHPSALASNKINRSFERIDVPKE